MIFLHIIALCRTPATTVWEGMLMRCRGDHRMASKASLADQQVQENVHAQIKTFSMSMDEILILDTKRIDDAHELPPQPTTAPP